MNLTSVKEVLKKEIGVFHSFEFRGARNQIEKFDGKIKKMFPAIFLIEVDDGSVRSFSYGDYIIHNIIIVS